MEHGPLLGMAPAIKGFIVGGLASGALEGRWGIAVQICLLVLAALIFLDCIYSFGREIHLLSVVSMALVGFAVGVLSLLAGAAGAYMAAVFLLLAFVYLFALVKGGFRKLPARGYSE